jgi:hypothetical protein
MPLFRRRAANFFLATLIFFTGVTVYAHDLVLQDVTAIKVGTCDNQVRFQVLLNAGDHVHATGDPALQIPLKYKIDITSPKRKKILAQYEVPDHRLNETNFFVVPSQLLICEDSVHIQIDSENRNPETNKNNNNVNVTLNKPKQVGLDNPCFVPPERCP